MLNIIPGHTSPAIRCSLFITENVYIKIILLLCCFMFFFLLRTGAQKKGQPREEPPAVALERHVFTKFFGLGTSLSQSKSNLGRKSSLSEGQLCFFFGTLTISKFNQRDTVDSLKQNCIIATSYCFYAVDSSFDSVGRLWGNN